ncbi:competence protein CoiA [Neobacillus bataviensis]|uniref:competence protein CoiA n=1 Tax=Neobacillus bataviensis TaxID=220685 RepID=UPI001CBCD3FA|nr:competence protein CoiA family protein [Neobacillus bataviensis]
MLTANTKSGKQVCLGYHYRKETLISLRNKEEFICPICGESVLLKLGDQRIFHFAHKSGGRCREFFENETINHMAGKRQLFQWLLGQNIPAVLEFYEKEIGQRPDIMFHYEGEKYALEYQCSPLPEKDFIKRTTNYLTHEYIPLWIIASSHIHKKRRNVVALSNFDYLFLRNAPKENYFIPSYCPENRQFHLLESIQPISIKNAFVQHSIYQLDKFSLERLLGPRLSANTNIDNWNKEKESFILNWMLHPNPKQNSFLHEIYKRNLNMFLLPPEIGLHVPHSILIQTPPIIWQTYLFIDLLADKQPQETFTLKELNFHFNKRVYRKEIILRNLPQLDSLDPISAEISYLKLLERIGVLTELGENTFKLERKILIPTSNREKEVAKLHFNQKYLNMLAKQ